MIFVGWAVSVLLTCGFRIDDRRASLSKMPEQTKWGAAEKFGVGGLILQLLCTGSYGNLLLLPGLCAASASSERAFLRMLGRITLWMIALCIVIVFDPPFSNSREMKKADARWCRRKNEIREEECCGRRRSSLKTESKLSASKGLKIDAFDSLSWKLYGSGTRIADS